MKRLLRLFGVLSIIFLFLLTSCTTTTELTYVRTDSSYNGGFLNSVMVVGVSENLARRKMFENAFVKQFEKSGVKAVSGAAAISPAGTLDKDIIKAEAYKLGIQAIFITHLVGIKREKVQRRPSTSASPPPSSYGEIDMYSYAAYDNTQYPGKDSEKRNIRLQNEIYELETEMLLWSASSETIDPKYVSDVIDSLSKVVMKNLRENKLIK